MANENAKSLNLHPLDRIGNVINKVTSSTLILLMGSMIVVVIANVFTRYILSVSITWSEEFARYAMVWLVFLGSSIALRQGDHVAIDYVVNSMPNRLKLFITLLMRGIVLYFLYILITKGLTVAQITSSQTSAALRLNMFWVYLAAPVGGILMAIQLLLIIFRDLSNKGLKN